MEEEIILEPYVYYSPETQELATTFLLEEGIKLEQRGWDNIDYINDPDVLRSIIRSFVVELYEAEGAFEENE